MSSNLASQPQQLTARGIERRRRFCLTAAKLFLAHGYERVTVDQVAREAKGSKSDLYASFTNKEGLFRSTLEFLKPPPFDPKLPPDIGPKAATSLLAIALVRYYTTPSYIAFHRLALVEASRFPEIGSIWLDRVLEHTRGAVRDVLGPNLDSDDIQFRSAILHDAIVFEPLHRALAGQLPSQHDLSRGARQAAEHLTRLIGITPRGQLQREVGAD